MDPMMNLPPEYQAELQKIARQRALAEAFQKQALTPQQTQFAGNVAVRQSPLGALARMLTAGMAGSALSDSDTRMGGIVKTAQDAENSQMQQVMGMSPQARVAAALSSQFPRIQGLGKDMQKQQAEAVQAGGKELIAQGDPSAGIGALSSGALPSNYRKPELPGPTFGQDSSGNPYAITTGVKGEKGIHYAPKGIQFNLPGKEGEAALDVLKTQLQGRQKEAGDALNILNSNRTAYEALNEGARAGGGEGIKQSIRKIAQGFGIEDAATAPTEKLSMALGDQLLANARKLAPVTENDMSLLRQLKGSVATDPSALMQMLAITSAAAYKSVQDYHSYVDQNTEQNLKTPYAADMFRSAKVGYDLAPNVIGGNAANQLRIVQELKNRGGDITRFADETGKPFDANTNFNIGNRAILPPQLGGGAPAPGNNVPLTVDQLSPAQKAQLLKLLGAGG